jgi:hypothetical protein
MSPENKNISNEKMSASNKSSNVRRNYNEVWKGVAGLSTDLQSMINKMTILNYTKKYKDDEFFKDGNNDGMDGRLMKYIDTQNDNVIFGKLLPLQNELNTHTKIMKKNRRKYNKVIKKKMDKLSHTTIETDTDLHMFVPEDVDIKNTETKIQIHNLYSIIEDVSGNTDMKLVEIIKVNYLLPFLQQNIYDLLQMMDKDAELEVKKDDDDNYLTIFNEDFNDDLPDLDEMKLNMLFDLIKKEDKIYTKLLVKCPFGVAKFDIEQKEKVFRYIKRLNKN